MRNDSGKSLSSFLVPRRPNNSFFITWVRGRLYCCLTSSKSLASLSLSFSLSSPAILPWFPREGNSGAKIKLMFCMEMAINQKWLQSIKFRASRTRKRGVHQRTLRGSQKPRQQGDDSRMMDLLWQLIKGADSGVTVLEFWLLYLLGRRSCTGEPLCLSFLTCKLRVLITST